jgi:hypothetical protein
LGRRKKTYRKLLLTSTKYYDIIKIQKKEGNHLIYRHYKGGLYYNVGFATRFSKDFPATSIEQIAYARYTEAVSDEEKEPIAVLSVLDKSTGSMYHAYKSDLIQGIHTFYKGLDGNYWLRPRHMFFEEVEEGRPRFKKCSGEELFETISRLIEKS